MYQKIPQNLTKLPKADLHVHLNGAIPTSIAYKLLKPIAHSLPEWFDLKKHLTVNKPVNGLQEYFKPWYALKKLPYSKDCLETLIGSSLLFLYNDNVKYVELRNSPFNISEINNIPLIDAIIWLIDSIEKWSQEIGIDARLILSLSRYKLNSTKIYDLLKAIRSLKYNSTLVGVDLSGNEDTPVDPEVEMFFKKAKDNFGLGVTIHAGETGNIDNVYWAINECQADRISHGLAAAKSRELMQELIANKICVEICLSSNYLTRTVSELEYHPIFTFIDQGVPFVLCSDNPCINNSNLSQNYKVFEEITNRKNILLSMFENQMRFSFKNIR